LRGVDSRNVFRDVPVYAFSNARTVLGATFRLHVLCVGLCLAKCIRFNPRSVVVMRLDFDCSGDAYQRAPRFTHSNSDRLCELRFEEIDERNLAPFFPSPAWLDSILCDGYTLVYRDRAAVSRLSSGPVGKRAAGKYLESPLAGRQRPCPIGPIFDGAFCVLFPLDFLLAWSGTGSLALAKVLASRRMALVAPVFGNQFRGNRFREDSGLLFVDLMAGSGHRGGLVLRFGPQFFPALLFDSWLAFRRRRTRRIGCGALLNLASNRK
jgi:hypothetical protein